MSDTPAPARHANGRFGPGNPGRRNGARNRVSHRAAMAILEDFELHKDELLHRLRIYHAPAYFAILNRLLDRELQNDAPALDDYDEVELARTVALARSALCLNQSPRAALLELEGVLVSQASLDPTAEIHRVNGD
jgi:hypothetical protein